MLTTDGSLPQQLGVVWSRLLEADSEGPSFISHAACARSVSSSRTFLSCACGAPSIVQRGPAAPAGAPPPPSQFAQRDATWRKGKVVGPLVGLPPTAPDRDRHDCRPCLD